jgi:hypothetical protein
MIQMTTATRTLMMAVAVMCLMTLWQGAANAQGPGGRHPGYNAGPAGPPIVRDRDRDARAFGGGGPQAWRGPDRGGPQRFGNDRGRRDRDRDWDRGRDGRVQVWGRDWDDHRYDGWRDRDYRHHDRDDTGALILGGLVLGLLLH